MNGYAIFKYSNGDEYKGHVQCGKRTGYGVYTEMNGNKLYANWKDDLISENPISSDIEWPELSNIMKEFDDDIERLNFKRFIQDIENPNLKRSIEDLEVDIKKCQGVYIIVGGFKYCGGWKNRAFDGKGLFTSRVGINYYGDLKAGLRHGNGICIFDSEHIYIGEWNNDQMEGIGRLEYGKDFYYTGALKNNMKEGKGILKYPNGDVFDGYFQNELPHGQGVLTSSDGKELQGCWYLGQLISQ